uniref:Uncharacterized protein n=1 Tax=Strombidium inclinatum TaxID=197538 RepID=A0A7S3IMW7_9SPIT|mmetsp:Transcript_29442/g.44590  ORF Transcript_29442/g.44590 Transcript_29442/m.44590 type:complete len:182 (+) Transcript_29442:860-1405(+)
MSSDYFKYYDIKGVYLDAKKELQVDIQILTDGFTTEANTNFLNNLVANQDQVMCCYEDIPGQKYAVKKNLNGFARIVTYSYLGGSVVLREGHFMDGVQNNFGRIVDLRNDDQELSFVGWFPQANIAGKGISKQGNKMFEGEFSPSKEFGASAGDYSSLLNKFEIKTFEGREKGPWWQMFPS